jgi:hypothetical protein
MRFKYSKRDRDLYYLHKGQWWFMAKCASELDAVRRATEFCEGNGFTYESLDVVL